MRVLEGFGVKDDDDKDDDAALLLCCAVALRESFTIAINGIPFGRANTNLERKSLGSTEF